MRSRRIRVQAIDPCPSLAVGDSQVRLLDRIFCFLDTKRSRSVCMPGAGMGDGSDMLDVSV